MHTTPEGTEDMNNAKAIAAATAHLVDTDQTAPATRTRSTATGAGNQQRARADQPTEDGAREHSAADLKPVTVMLRSGELDDGNPGTLRAIWSYLKGGQWDIEAAYDDQWITRTGAELRLRAQLAEHGMQVIAFLSENDEYLPQLIAECQRVGLALQLTDDPGDGLARIKVIDGRKTVLAPSGALGTAYDDVHSIGRCMNCSTILGDTGRRYDEGHEYKDMTGGPGMVCAPRCNPQAVVNRAITAIHRAVRISLDGLTTHPRTTAEQLIDAANHASAMHLMRRDVGNVPIGEARASEAFSTALHGIKQALELTPNREGMALALRTALDMYIAETDAPTRA